MKPIQPICTLRSYLSYIILSVLFALPSFVFGQNIILSTQAQVDTFSQTEVIGNLTVSGPDITNLDGLSDLVSVSTTFYIENNPQLTNLNGLSNLTSVSALEIRGNLMLATLNGLSTLTTITGLAISDNPALVNLYGLSGITSILILNVFNNASLINLEGLSALQTVTLRLYIYNNDALINLEGLSALTLVQGRLHIARNASLINLEGLSALTSLGDLEIWSNPALQSLQGLSALASVDDYGYYPYYPGNIDIYDNSSLTNLAGLTSLTFIYSSLTIRDNDALINLSIPANLDTIRRLGIQDNDALINLNGLSNITYIGQLNVASNGALINLEGLSSLNFVGRLFITNNTSMSSLYGLENLTSVSSSIRIRNNPVLQNLDALSSLTWLSSCIISNNAQLASFCGLFPVFDGGTYGSISISGNAVNPTISEIIANGACVSIACPSDATFFTDIGICCASINLVPPTVQGGNSTTTLVNDYNNTSDASDTYFVTTTVVTWTATDAYGNQISCAQNITVMDNEAPQFGVPDPSCSMYQSCYDALTLGLSNNETIYQQALAACNGDSLCIRAADRAKVRELEEIRKIFRLCLEGNTNCSLVPISGALPDLIVSGGGENCEAQVDNPGPVVAENCAAFILTNDYATATNALGSGIYPEGTTTVTWTATDQFGNVSMITRNIIVTTEECVIDPIEVIDDLVAAGLITQGQANALLIKLENCNLNAFENQVNAFVNNGTLTQEQADTLIAAAIAHCPQLKSGTIGNRSSDMSFSLGQNYPNPSNATTIIPFSLATDGHVNLKLYNTNGKVVKNILEEYLQIGNHEVEVNMQMLSAGVYFYRIETSGDTQTLILIKE